MRLLVSDSHIATPTQPEVSLEVSNDELYSVRDAMRSLNRLISRLHDGELSQIVLMKGGKMVAVLRPIKQPEENS